MTRWDQKESIFLAITYTLSFELSVSDVSGVPL